MPVVSVARDALFERLGDWFGATKGQPSKEADKKFDELCFAYGIELDDVTSEREMKSKESGKTETGSDEIIYKIDVPANRYDILCLEGLSRALRIFRGSEVPQYTLTKPQTMQKMIVKSEVKSIRPHVVCAVLRNLKFTPQSYQSFIDLQEKLHQNICRRRTLVSIGTHDLATVKGPFTYEALPPKDIKFAPLNSTTVMDAVSLFDHYEKTESHLKKYLHIIKDSPVYPVVFDSNRVVMSLPPIINGDHSKITLNTKDVFIEVTATDLTKAEIVLNVMCTMFSEYADKLFTIEPVEVINADGKSVIYPDLSNREFECKMDYINKSLGLSLSVNEAANLLKKMSLHATSSNNNNNTLKVQVPCTRSDILHSCDIMEDVGIAYGFNKLPISIPTTSTYGKQQPLNKLSDQLRSEIAMAGYTEVLTLALCSRDENFKMLNKPDDASSITISNPATAEFQVARTSLLVGMLKTVSHNRKMPLPIKVFEISDVVLRDPSKDVGVKNKRNICAMYCGHTSGFEVVHGLLDTIMVALNVAWKKSYELKPSEDSSYFPGRRADIIVNGEKVGVIGTVHPEVLGQYGVPYPAAALEMCLESFV